MPNSTSAYAASIPLLSATVTGIISALVTQFLTLRFGLKKFVGEKELSRSMEWHEKVYHAIAARQMLISSLFNAVFSDNEENALESIARLSDSARELIVLLDSSQIFSSSNSYVICDNLAFLMLRENESFSREVDSFSDEDLEDESNIIKVRERMLVMFSNEEDGLLKAKVALADDMRRKLGLEALPANRTSSPSMKEYLQEYLRSS